LFAAIGTTYGVGDGSTTFALPDLRGRVIAGVDNMGGTDAGRLSISNTLGTATGSETHTLTADQMPAHSHEIHRSNSAATSVGADASALYRTLVNTGAVYTTTQAAGGGSAHNIMQPTMVLNYIIKA
jgi:microcystin-dependent protein